MPQRSEEFLKRLQAAFTAEAAEHCEALSAGLLQLESAPETERPGLVEKMFRSAHSLKGAARAVNLTGVEAICHRLEGVFAQWKRQPPQPGPQAFDTLHRSVDAIRDLVRAPQAAGGAADGPAALLREIEQLEHAAAGGASVAARAAPVAPAPSSAKPAAAAAIAPQPATPATESWPAGGDLEATVRVTTERVEGVLYATEELLAIKSGAAQRTGALRDILELLETSRREAADAQAALRGVRQAAAATPAPGGERPPDLAALVDLVDRGEILNRTLTEKLGALARTQERERRELGKLVDSLLDETKKLLLLPFATEQAFFSKLLRDLARDQGKDVEFVFRGGEVEIDKRILQEMKAPLVHLLRNCVDHGMERPEERVRAGKPPRGTITLAVTQLELHNIELRIEDDGAGIALESVKQAALRRGLVTPNVLVSLSRDEVMKLIFRADVSTAPLVTEVSGRGIGLAIVAERVEKLGGRLSVASEPGRGTSFRIVLPVTQSTFRGVLVAVGDRLFVLPTTRVERIVRCPRSAIQTVENRETIPVDGRPVAFVRLADALELPRAAVATAQNGFVHAVVLGNADGRLAFGVDAVLGDEEVMVKPLRKPLVRVRNVAGATVLGSGAVVPILNVPDLLKSGIAVGSGTARAAAPVATAAARRSILVAEDSITSRMLLKNILESAGYAVQTAVDGLDALTTLRAGRFDLVVSDIEMPRLNGFALTAAIRADRKLSETPVILVSALATREDRERGIDVGANAYLVKSDFDQGNLLEAVRRFI